jgi:hypothetical protein
MSPVATQRHFQRFGPVFLGAGASSEAPSAAHAGTIMRVPRTLRAYPSKLDACATRLASWSKVRNSLMDGSDMMRAHQRRVDGVSGPLDDDVPQQRLAQQRQVADQVKGFVAAAGPARGASSPPESWPPSINPYVQEHINMIRSIRGDGPYLNYSLPIAESTLTAIMGRESAYSGQEITWDQIVNSQLDLMPKAFGYDVKMDPAPLPVPGTYKFV